MGKNAKTLSPCRKRMKSAARLASATGSQWIQRFTGKDIVRSYARWYGVDLLCAVIELRLLGVPITAGREQRAQQTTAARAAQRAARKREREPESSIETYIDEDIFSW